MNNAAIVLIGSPGSASSENARKYIREKGYNLIVEFALVLSEHADFLSDIRLNIARQSDITHFVVAWKASSADDPGVLEVPRKALEHVIQLYAFLETALETGRAVY